MGTLPNGHPFGTPMSQRYITILTCPKLTSSCPASEPIAGLRVIGNEAVSILHKRFGDTDQIVSTYMEGLLTLEAVTLQHNLKTLCWLHDQVESHVRDLKALGIAAESYGSFLAPVILSKLPQEFWLIVSREVREGRQELDELMRVINAEIKAREHAINTSNSGSHLTKAPGSINTLGSHPPSIVHYKCLHGVCLQSLCISKESGIRV